MQKKKLPNRRNTQAGLCLVLSCWTDTFCTPDRVKVGQTPHAGHGLGASLRTRESKGAKLRAPLLGIFSSLSLSLSHHTGKTVSTPSQQLVLCCEMIFQIKQPSSLPNGPPARFIPPQKKTKIKTRDTIHHSIFFALAAGLVTSLLTDSFDRFDWLASKISALETKRSLHHFRRSSRSSSTHEALPPPCDRWQSPV